MKYIYTTGIFLFILLPLYAQKEANTWYFGRNAGVDFNSGAPVALTNGQLSTSEGCATISDANGNLLFYTDGITVWDRNHNVMPNGTGLMGHPSSAQSAIIVPKPGSKTIYYIFTVPYSATPAVGLRYSEVDMSLRSGLGDITVNKNILLASPACEKLTSVKHANGVDYWVIIKKTNTNQFNAFHVDCNGVNTTPVVSNAGINTNTWGYLAASPDGKRLAMAENSPGFELYDFDNATGVVSNPILLGNGGGAYGVAFSPDNNLLYGLRIHGGAIYQWNLLAGSPAAIIASATQIGTAVGTGSPYLGGALQLATDGKIYVPDFNWPSLSVINNPNVSGVGCNFQTSVVNLLGSNAVLGLPPFVSGFFAPDFTVSDSCQNRPVTFNIAADTSLIDSVKWDFGDPLAGPGNYSTDFQPTHTYTNPGLYLVKLTFYVSCAIDTVTDTVLINPAPVTTLNPSICQGDAFFAGGQWQTNPGTYYDTLSTYLGCDSIIVTNLTVNPVKTTTIDTAICQGDAFFAGGQWQTNPGTYYDTLATYLGCDSIIITNLTVNPVKTTTIDTAICQGDAFFAGGQWQTSPGTYYDTLSTYLGCDSIIITNLTVNPVKTTTIDTAICQGDAFFAGGQWQTNPGSYYDTLATYLGCDSIIITNLTVNPVPNTLINIEICDGDSIFAGGQWQYFAGSYYDTLQTFRGCDSIIETRLTVHPSYLDTIDASICDGDQYWAGGQWQSSPGVYTDMYLSVKGCDSIVVTRLTVHPVFLVNLDTTICYGQTYLSPGGNPYTQSGQYLDTLQSGMGCDSVILTRLTVSQPVVDLGNDTFICEGNTILLDAGNHSGYQWQDNSTGQVYTVTEEGVYSVTVTDTAGCTATDSIILIHRCPYRLFIPNAFSPNDDGVNDVFKIYGKDLLNARLSIYNRWGEKCFETDDISEGWDGRVNGKIAEPGVYVWQLYFEGYDEQLVPRGQMQTGSVVLLR